MADKGGQTTQSGVDYQNKIATLFLGRMIDPGPWPKTEEIIEVRNEDPSAEVDDVVVHYQDHTVWIQVKLDMKDTGNTWIKFWKHIFAQRWNPDHPFGKHDRLALAISRTPDWVKHLEEICGRARGSEKSLELATLDQQVAEWQGRLSGEQKALLDNIVADVSGKKRSKGKSEQVSTTDEPSTLETGESVPAEYLQPEKLFELFTRMEVWLQFNPNKIEIDHGRSYLPKATLEWFNLFDTLFKIIGDNARYGKSISRNGLVQELNKKNIFILGSTSLIPVAASLPKQYIHRRGIEIPLVRYLRKKSNEGVPKLVGLVGNGGFGKTGLAKAIANDPRVLKKYPDGVLWVELGQTPDLHNILENQVKVLTGKSPGFIGLGETGLNEAANALAEELRSRRLLIVLDDVWQKKVLEYFLPGAAQSALLVTTRLPEIVPPDGIVDVKEMEKQEAARLLVSWTRVPPQDMLPFFDLAKKLGEWPLLVELAAGTLKESVEVDRLTLDEALLKLQERLDHYGFTAFDSTDENDRKKAISISINISLERLEKQDRLGNIRPRYLELAVFPEGEYIPFSTIEKLWKATTGMGRILVEDALKAMHRLSLFDRYEVRGRTLRLHDVIRAYMVEQVVKEQVVNELSALHRKLLDGYGLDDWTELPTEEPYLWRRLAFHLREAGCNAELYSLIGKPWMQARFARYWNHKSFSEDVDIAIQAADKEENLPELARLCLLYATLGELASNAPPDLLGVLARYGQAETALGYAALMHEAERRCDAYRLIGEVLLAIGESGRGKAALNQALAAVEKIEDEHTKAESLSGVVQALAQARDWEGALAAVEKVGDDKKAAFLNVVAQAMARAGDRDGALVVAQQALGAVDKIEYEWLKAEALSEVAQALAQAGDREGALVIAGKALTAAEIIEGDYPKAQALSEAAQALAQAGERDMVLDVARRVLAAAEKMRGDYPKAQVLSRVAQALAQAGDRDGALAAAEKIGGDYDRVEALSRVAQALALAGDRDGALSAAEKIGGEYFKVKALSEVAQALALAGDRDGALEAAGKIEWESDRARALGKATQALAQAGDRDGALAAVEKIRYGGYKSEVLSWVAQALARAGDRDGALDVAHQALALVSEIRDEFSRAKVLGGVAQAQAQAGDQEGSLQAACHALEAARQALAAEKIGGEYYKAKALSGMAQALAQAGDREGSRQVARRAMAEAEKIKDKFSVALPFSLVARALIQAGDQVGARYAARQALAAAEEIWDERYKAHALIVVAQALARASDRKRALGAARQALAAAEKIDIERYKARALIEVAQVLARVGDQKRALAVSEKLEDEYERVEALINVAQALVETGRRRGVRQVLALAKNIEDKWAKAEALIGVAQALAQAGDRDKAVDIARQALEAADKIGRAFPKTLAFSRVAQAQAQAGDRQAALDAARQALEAAEKIDEWGSLKAEALGRVAQALAQAGDRDGAQEAARQALVLAKEIGIDEDRANALSEVAQALAQAGDREGLRRVLAAAEKIEEEKYKAEALSEVARALAQAGDRDGALAAAEKIGDEQRKAQALSEVAQALHASGDLITALEVFRLALQTARFAWRRAIFTCLETGAMLLAGIDQGKTLRQIDERMIEVDCLWAN